MALKNRYMLEGYRLQHIDVDILYHPSMEKPHQYELSLTSDPYRDHRRKLEDVEHDLEYDNKVFTISKLQVKGYDIIHMGNWMHHDERINLGPDVSLATYALQGMVSSFFTQVFEK